MKKYYVKDETEEKKIHKKTLARIDKVIDEEEKKNKAKQNKPKKSGK